MSEVVRVIRTLPATPPRVFAAWTEAEQLKRWLCPEPGHVVDAACDPVVGGAYRLVMRYPAGSTEITGEYLVVDRPHRLVFSWVPDGDAARESRVSVLLEPDGAGTRMTIVHERAVDRHYREALAAGWASVADRLHHLLNAATEEMPSP